jgi:transposase InsO family protein
VLKQAIASTIPDSLFLDVRKELMAQLMWDAVTNKREKKSRMVTVDLRRKLQSEKCDESGDVRAHLIKLQTMREDLASMGGSISDEDFTSIILGSIPLSYDTFISAMSATSTLLGSSLSPTNLIDAIGDEADRKAIKTPTKSKKDDHDAAFTAGPQSRDGRRSGRSGASSGSRKPKKDIECFNCHKKGHMKADCWAPGGGSEGKGPRGRKGKETAAKASPEAETDGVWMADAEANVARYALERFVHQWRADIPRDGEMLWDASEMAEEVAMSEIMGYETYIDECIASPSNGADATDDLSSESDISESILDSCPGLEAVSDSSSESSDAADSCPDLQSVSDSSASESEADIVPKDLGPEARTRTYDAAMLANGNAPAGVETELYDSGASRHMSPYRHKFISYIDIEPKTITAADSGTFQAIGRGDMHIEVPNGKTTTRILLRDVLYAPKMGLTLVSISRIAAAGFTTIFRQDSAKIFGPRKSQLGCIKVQGGLYRVEHGRFHDTAASASTGVVTIEELHRLMGHISPEVARAMVKKGMVEGIKLDEASEIRSCDSCEYGKAHRKPIRKVRKAERARAVGEEVHSDVWGKSPVQTINGREYYVTFTDDHSRFTHLYLLRTKDETFDAYTTYESMMRTQKGTRIKRIHSDRRGEYLSGPFDDHLAKAGTLRNLTVHDTPEHNGVSERLNRTLLEKVRAMLHSSGLPKFLWGEAVKHAVYLKNRTPTIALDEQTPFEAFFGKKPDLEGLREFGTKVWVHDANGSKLDGRSTIGRWVGFDEESSGHRIYWPERRSVSIERSVKFENEAEILLPNSAPLEGENSTAPLPKNSSKFEQPTVPNLPRAPIIPENPATTFMDNPTVDHLGRDFEQPPDNQGHPKQIRQESAALRRLRDGEGFISDCPSERNQLPKGIQKADEAARMAQSDDWEVVDLGIRDMSSGMVAAMAEADVLEPTYEEARGRSDWPQWKDAIKVELEAL